MDDIQAMQQAMQGLLADQQALRRRVERLEAREAPKITWLTSPLTSTDFDGDSFANVSKTLIDLSLVFGVPAGVKAVLVQCIVRDSGSAGADCYLALGPTSTNGKGIFFDPAGLANNFPERNGGGCWVPCDSNGDIYYQTVATGDPTATMDVWIEIWGYIQ